MKKGIRVDAVEENQKLIWPRPMRREIIPTMKIIKVSR